jgi:uncharacterized damage-inducible protein DinB
MTTKAVQEGTVSAKLIERWEQVCQKMTVLAEAVPENKFDYRPVNGVRTLADILRHVAFWNRHVADSAHGRKGDDTANELPKDEFSTKTRIIGALKHNAASATEALKENPSGLSPDMAEMVVTFIEHTCEHYGQLVVYARLNGIIPPASRE